MLKSGTDLPESLATVFAVPSSWNSGTNLVFGVSPSPQPVSVIYCVKNNKLQYMEPYYLLLNYQH